MEQDISRSNSETSDDDTDAIMILQQLEESLTFHQVSKERVQSDGTYSKSLKTFVKSLNRVTKSKKSVFEKALFTFGKEQGQARTPGRKKGKLIPVQTTARSRRTYKHRGRGPSILGRRKKDCQKRVQLVIDDEVVRHSMPKQKKNTNKETSFTCYLCRT